jgi:hypothetical protein
MPTLDDLTEPWEPGQPPWLDDPDARPVDPLQRQWQRYGYVILPKFMPDHLIDAYAEAWQADNGPEGRFGDRPMGWPYDVPYMNVPALMDLACHDELADVLDTLIGDDMAVHLNLTGWRSTTRDWHQDGYLNPDTNRDWYAAVWVALDDIDADAGPFEYVPGSHRAFAPIRQKRMLTALEPDERGPTWPRHSERILTPLFEDEMRRNRTIPHRFLAKRGDVLIWHARLLHRGSPPRNPDLERRAVILHYSGRAHRPDMPVAVQRGKGWYFPIDQGGHR